LKFTVKLVNPSSFKKKGYDSIASIIAALRLKIEVRKKNEKCGYNYDGKK
jgi:hypothetical protein